MTYLQALKGKKLSELILLFIYSIEVKKIVEDFPRRSAFTFFFTTINQGTISVWEKLCLGHRINKDFILIIEEFQ